MDRNVQQWNRILEVLDFESDTSNFKVGFKVLSKKYGQQYIILCKALWGANYGVLSVEEFIKLNGNMPEGFFNKVINNGR